MGILTETLRGLAEDIENAKESAKALINDLGARLAEAITNEDFEAALALANEMQDDADELAAFVVANTVAEEETPTGDGETDGEEAA